MIINHSYKIQAMKMMIGALKIKNHFKLTIHLLQKENSMTMKEKLGLWKG